MTLREKIQEVNKSEDPEQLFRLVEGLLAGSAIVGRTGAPIQVSYENIQGLFKIHAGVDEKRFEYLMKRADSFIPSEG